MHPTWGRSTRNAANLGHPPLNSINDTHYSESELATYFHCNPRTLKRWRQTRSLPYRRIGGRIFYNKDSIARWLAEQEHRGPALRKAA